MAGHSWSPMATSFSWELRPWSKIAKQYLSAHRRILKDLGEDALGSFEHQLLATKRASLELQMWENPVHGGSFTGAQIIGAPGLAT